MEKKISEAQEADGGVSAGRANVAGLIKKQFTKVSCFFSVAQKRDTNGR